MHSTSTTSQAFNHRSERLGVFSWWNVVGDSPRRSCARDATQPFIGADAHLVVPARRDHEDCQNKENSNGRHTCFDATRLLTSSR